jgi:hypothetical protein
MPYIKISREQMLNFAHEIGEKIQAGGGNYRFGFIGKEIVFRYGIPERFGKGKEVRFYTSLGEGDKALRGKGKDAVRVVGGIQGDTFKVAIKARRINRTVGKGKGEDAFFDRVRDRLRYVYGEMRVMRYCNKCNSHMVLRKSEYGSFWGCSNYPQCRVTKKGD